MNCGRMCSTSPSLTIYHVEILVGPGCGQRKFVELPKWLVLSKTIMSFTGNGKGDVNQAATCKVMTWSLVQE